MANELALVTPLFNEAARPPTLPASLQRSLADPFALGSNDVPWGSWQLPRNLPRESDVRFGISELERALQPVSDGHMAWCMTLMAKTLASKSGGMIDWALRTTGWIRACGELPDDLWTNATDIALKSAKWFPEPVEFMKFDNVAETFSLRQRMLKRAEAILAIVGGTAQKALPPPVKTQRDPVDHIHRASIWRGWDSKINNPSFMTAMLMKSACTAERELARLEAREPAPWALVDVPPTAEPKSAADRTLKSRPDTPATKAALLTARIRYWHGLGNATMVAKLRAELDAIPISTDIPEARI